MKELENKRKVRNPKCRVSQIKMKIETTDNNCILARLSARELESFELTCDELRSSSERAREVLKKILDEVQTETGSLPERANRLNVEVLPDCSGGCLIMFLPMNEECSETSIFETADADALLDLILALRKEKNFRTASALFEKDGIYRLTVRGASERLNRLLKEYLAPVFSDGMEHERTDEAFRCLMKDHALEILCGTFS